MKALDKFKTFHFLKGGKFFLYITLMFLISACQKEEAKITVVDFDKTNIYPEINQKLYPIIPTFLGNFTRNYYGNEAPDKLELIGKLFLGVNTTKVGSKELKWGGAGWTGQPLLFLEDTILYIVQGTYSHRLMKIKADGLSLKWAYDFEDMIKGTGTFYHKVGTNLNMIIQGARLGKTKNLRSKVVPSYRAIDFYTGKNLWKLNSRKTASYSRDVDGSTLILNDTAYIGLENGIFTVYNPDPDSAEITDNILQPEIFEEHYLYYEADRQKHRGNLVTESSPSVLNNHIYISSGSGHIWGYNLKTRKIDFDFKTGSDIDGSPVVTDDGCIIVAIEKEYIKGQGGVFKIDPTKPADSCVVWFFPVENKKFASWQGGVIGSATVNDHYIKAGSAMPNLCAFSAIDGNLYVVKSKELSGNFAWGPNLKHRYPTPKLAYKYYISNSISTPVFVGNKIVAASYDGIHLFSFDDKLNFKMLAHYQTNSTEATPSVFNRKIFIASKDGHLYILGEKGKPINPNSQEVAEMQNFPMRNIYYYMRKSLAKQDL